MALQSNGPLALSEIRTEFKTLSGDVAFSELYGIAEGVNTTGPMSLSTMLSKAYVFVKTLTVTTTNLDISTLFTVDEWNSDTPKEVRIPSGLIVGSANPTLPAMTIPNSGNGVLKIVNAGQILASGGISPSQAGGNAILNQRNFVTIENSGTIAGGGGAGGNGGVGGAGGTGVYTATAREPSSGDYFSDFAYPFGVDVNANYNWGGSYVGRYGDPVANGGYLYYRGSFRGEQWVRTGPDGDGYNASIFGIYRTWQYNVYTGGGAGGAGGTGGRGQGYLQTALGGTAGAGGAGGGINAGTGGTGGAGGSGGGWATAGGTGATGNTGGGGNAGGGAGGAAGGAGGAAGRAITGVARTLINTGTILGTVNV